MHVDARRAVVVSQVKAANVGDAFFSDGLQPPSYGSLVRMAQDETKIMIFIEQLERLFSCLAADAQEREIQTLTVLKAPEAEHWVEILAFAVPEEEFVDIVAQLWWKGEEARRLDCFSGHPF